MLAIRFIFVSPQVIAFLRILKMSCKRVEGSQAGWAVLPKLKLEKEGRAQGTPATPSFLDLVQILQIAAK